MNKHSRAKLFDIQNKGLVGVWLLFGSLLESYDGFSSWDGHVFVDFYGLQSLCFSLCYLLSGYCTVAEGVLE